MNQPIITEQQLERALEFLASTDEPQAHQKADVERAEILRKRVRAKVFLTAEGSVEARRATAETSPETAAADDDYIAALVKYEGTKAKRERADIVVRVFQTLSANRRQG